MTPNFSPDIQKLIAKKPLERDDIRPLKKALRKYAEDYVDLNKGGNSQINLTDTFTNDIKVADANYNFIRDIGRQMERSRDYVMHENIKENGQKEIVVLPLDRPLIEKYATHFAIGGIIFGTILSILGGVLGDYLKGPSQTKKYIPKNIEVKSTILPDSASTIYQIEIKDSAK